MKKDEEQKQNKMSFRAIAFKYFTHYLWAFSVIFLLLLSNWLLSLFFITIFIIFLWTPYFIVTGESCAPCSNNPEMLVSSAMAVETWKLVVGMLCQTIRSHKAGQYLSSHENIGLNKIHRYPYFYIYLDYWNYFHIYFPLF